MAKSKAQEIVSRILREKSKKGINLKKGSKERDQAIAIALSEARRKTKKGK